MFEDVKRQDEHVMTGDPNKVEDMFDKVEPAAMPSAMEQGKLRPVGSESQPPPPPAAVIGPKNPLTHLSQIEDWSAQKKRGGKRWLIIGVVVILLLVAGAAAYFFFFASPSPFTTLTPPSDTPIDTSQPADTSNANIVDNSNVNTAPPGNDAIDKDTDGLTDIEEQAMGTNPLSNDTDSDGLGDRDEVQVHKTNPLVADTDNDGLGDREEAYVWFTNPNNADSDGDTYQDGAEVANGYDPNGPGKLVPTDNGTVAP